MVHIEGIREEDISDQKVLESFRKHLADCVILTHDNRLLMQKRPDNWGASAGALNIFGGHVEEGESIMDGLVREIEEELGARMDENDVIFIGAVSEAWTNHTELVHVHFWHDTKNEITGCYEALPAHFETAEDALHDPHIMDYAKWALQKCLEKGLIK